MSTVSNSLRVLTIHLLAAIHSFQDNAYSHHIMLQIASAVRTLAESAVRVRRKQEEEERKKRRMLRQKLNLLGCPFFAVVSLIGLCL